MEGKIKQQRSGYVCPHCPWHSAGREGHGLRSSPMVGNVQIVTEAHNKWPYIPFWQVTIPRSWRLPAWVNEDYIKMEHGANKFYPELTDLKLI